MNKILERFFAKEFNKLMYFINSLIVIFQASCQHLWRAFSSELALVAPCYNENHSNNSKKLKLDRNKKFLKKLGRNWKEQPCSNIYAVRK